MSTAAEGTSLWTIHKDTATLLASIDSANESTEQNVPPLACVNNDATVVAVYRGNLQLNIYSVSAGSHSLKETRNLSKEVKTKGQVSELRFHGDKIRLSMGLAKDHWFIDVTIGGPTEVKESK